MIVMICHQRTYFYQHDNSFDSGNQICSKGSCCWLEYVSTEIYSQICHALGRHGDERSAEIGGKGNVPGDGYDCSKNKVFQYHSCYHHRQASLKNRSEDVNQRYEKSIEIDNKISKTISIYNSLRM